METPMENTQMMDKIHGVEEIIGYHFANSEIIWEALQDVESAVQVVGGRELVIGNLRLSIVGARVLDLALAEAWHKGDDAPRNRDSTRQDRLGLYADLHPVCYDRIIQKVNCNANLDRVGSRTGLVAFINQTPSTSGFDHPVFIAAAVRAILGAVYLDSNIETAKRVMNTLGLLPLKSGPDIANQQLVPPAA